MLPRFLEKARYALSEVEAHYDDRQWWKGRFQHRVVGDLYYGRLRGNDGVNVMGEDWDVLVVLDAAGYDLFRTQAALFDVDPDRVEKRISRGSATPQFLAENFPGEYPDTVYVTANPMVDVHVGDAFHDLISVWKTAWDDEENTVRPGPVREAAVTAAERYPDKRIIVHFMQPHWPFIGSDLTDRTVGFGATRARADEAFADEVDEDEHNLWDLVEVGVVDPERAADAFADNLRIALPDALAVARDLTGKAVVTADHGNAVGDWAWPFPIRIYGHPPGVRMRSLVEVPWLVVDDDERRPVRAESTSATEYDDEAASERLEALGYLE
jgi:hypothetical protein